MAIYRQRFVRGNGERYESPLWYCRFGAHGRTYRLSTGHTDPAEAQKLCDRWQQQARAGQPFDPPTPGRLRRDLMQNLADVGARVGTPPSDGDNPVRKVRDFILGFIAIRRSGGAAPEQILDEVEKYLARA